MVKVTTTGGTVHYLDPERGYRKRVPAPGRGEHTADGHWQPMMGYTGYRNGEHVDLTVGVQLLCIGPGFSWFLTSPVVTIEHGSEGETDALVD